MPHLRSFNTFHFHKWRAGENLAPIYVFPEMKLLGFVISKAESYSNVLSPNFHIHVSVSDIYSIFTGSVCLFCCSQISRSREYLNRSMIHECRIGNEFHFWEHINPIVDTVQAVNKRSNVWVFFPVHIKLGRNVISENVPEYVVDGATCYGDLGAPLYKVRKRFKYENFLSQSAIIFKLALSSCESKAVLNTVIAGRA
jgi:hypothetical protein